MIFVCVYLKKNISSYNLKLSAGWKHIDFVYLTD